MTVFLKLYGVALPTFLLIDLVWLGVVARGFYRSRLGHLMRPDVNWSAALAFYALFVAGLVVLAVWPAVERESFPRAVFLGGLVGLISYAAYDLTNLATLRDFPLTLALVDLCWGTVLCGAVSAVTFKVWFWIG